MSFEDEILSRDLAALTKSLSGETDRGMALVLASYCETLLDKILLKSFIQDGPVNINELMDRQSFYMKINLAHIIGKISIEEYNDLHTIRCIRNKFAHSFEVLNFSNPEIEKLCMELKVYKRNPRISDESVSTFSGRKRFIMIGQFLFRMLMRRTKEIEPFKEQTKDPNAIVTIDLEYFEDD
jgi:hypothetical protein